MLNTSTYSYNLKIKNKNYFFFRENASEPFRSFVRKYTYEIPNPLRLLYVNIRTQTGIKIWALLTDTLRYLGLCITGCSRAHHVLPVWVIQLLTSRWKVKFSRVRGWFLLVLGNLRMSDQVQLIACHGIQRQIIWIFCRESEVSG